MKRSILALLAALAAAVSLMTTALAVDHVETVDGYPVIGDNEEDGEVTIEDLAARVLYSYGLFNGSGVDADGYVDFMLTAPMTRQEAITMLVRMLGREEEALSGAWAMPFTDVDSWAAPYVGYAYANGLVNGITATTFGGKSRVNDQQYLTFTLRALGYSDAQGDFVWSQPYALAERIGIVSPFLTPERFQRGDAVLISFDALSAKPKGTDTTLLNKLISEGAAKRRAVALTQPWPTLRLTSAEGVPEQLRYAVERFGVTAFDIYVSADVDASEFASVVRQGAEMLGGTLYVFDTDVAEPYCFVSMDTDGVADDCGDGYYIKQYAENNIVYPRVIADCSEGGGAENDLPQVLAAYEKMYALYQSAVKPGMSDYEKTWAVYDAVARQTSRSDPAEEALRELDRAGGADYQARFAGYLEAYPRAASWMGVAYGEAVTSEGYAQAVNVLLYLAGVDSVYLNGWDESGGASHAWNKVCIDGKWYNLDAAWDDSGSGAGKEYFLKSDGAYQADGHQAFTKHYSLGFGPGSGPSILTSYESKYPAPSDY